MKIIGIRVKHELIWYLNNTHLLVFLYFINVNEMYNSF